MSTQPKTFLTEAEYLEIERKAEFRSEYFRGEMFAMAGAGFNHTLLVSNLVFSLRTQIEGRPCTVLPIDMRVRVAESGLYTYPDVVVLCGKPEFLDGGLDTLLNPTVIFEVLSPSTEAYDRGRKFELYQSIPSLSEYVLVVSDRVRVERYVRQTDGGWLLTSASAMGESLELQSVGCRLSLSELYDQVEFA